MNHNVKIKFQKNGFPLILDHKCIHNNCANMFKDTTTSSIRSTEIYERGRRLPTFNEIAQSVLQIERLFKEKAISVNKSFLVKCDNGKEETYTPLTYAIQNRSSCEVLDAIIKAGANVNTPCYIGMQSRQKITPLHLTMVQISDAFSKVQLLIDAGADVNQQTGQLIEMEEEGGQMSFFEGFSPLHWCVQRNDLTILQILLKAGANVNSETCRHGEMPIQLIHSFEHNNELLIRTLICYGGLTMKKNSMGETLFQSIVDHSRFTGKDYTSLVKFVLYAGYDLKKDDIRHNFHCEAENLNTMTYNVIYNWLYKPCRLQVLCRCRIRQTIGTRVTPLVFSSLQIPSHLQTYLALEHGID